MNKKNIIYLVVAVFIVVVAISIMVAGPKGDTTEVSEDYESSYYVEANRNIFVKFANLCDDGCYHVVHVILGGIESVFSFFIGN